MATFTLDILNQTLIQDGLITKNDLVVEVYNKGWKLYECIHNNIGRSYRLNIPTSMGRINATVIKSDDVDSMINKFNESCSDFPYFVMREDNHLYKVDTFTCIDEFPTIKTDYKDNYKESRLIYESN
jgi:hypothetical protein